MSPAGPGETAEPRDIDALVRAGDYAGAAEAAAAAGDPARASALYEKIWEFGRAAECAREAGDLSRALALAIDARDEGLVLGLAAALDGAGDAGKRAAMEAFAGRRRFAEAAHRAEAVGELERAIEYYSSAHRDLDAGRVLESVGRDREAGRLYERLLELGAPGDEAALAAFRLGRLLQRRMQHDRAVQHLQQAARHDVTRDEAQRALILSLAALGWRDAARDVLLDVRGRDPGVPADLDGFVQSAREVIERERRPERAGDRAQLIGGRYRIEDMVGAGGSGRVFRARDEVSERQVAVKVFHASAARGHRAYERFVREAKVAGGLRHPNLVEVYDFSEAQGYLVMEYMTGGSLRERLCGPMPGSRVKRLVADVLAGLELAHQRGVIHRDVKPENIFFDARGTAKLGDFGVAHLLDLGATQTGGLIGTLAYMSPEQITGAPLTIAADLYALGVTMFEALTGQQPFLGPDFVAQHLGEEPPPTSVIAAGVAPGWDPVLARLLAKNPDDRFESVDALRRAVAAVSLGESTAPAALMLPRAVGRARAEVGSGSGPDEAEDDAAGTAATAGEGADAGDDQPPRYQYETAIGAGAISRLSRAVDGVLGRSVIIERFADGHPDEPTRRRLYALARGGGPFLQRALSYDRAAGVAVFEAPSGTPIGDALRPKTPDATVEPGGAAAGPASSDGPDEPRAGGAGSVRAIGPRAAIRLVKRLARAVAPLHETGNAHGALGGTTVLVDDELNPTVLAAGLGPVDGDPSPADDVAAVVALIAGVFGGASPTAGVAEALIEAFGGSLAPADRAAALRDAGELNTGEALYAFADMLEVATLRARRAR